MWCLHVEFWETGPLEKKNYRLSGVEKAKNEIILLNLKHILYLSSEIVGALNFCIATLKADEFCNYLCGLSRVLMLTKNRVTHISIHNKPPMVWQPWHCQQNPIVFHVVGWIGFLLVENQIFRKFNIPQLQECFDRLYKYNFNLYSTCIIFNIRGATRGVLEGARAPSDLFRVGPAIFANPLSFHFLTMGGGVPLVDAGAGSWKFQVYLKC